VHWANSDLHFDRWAKKRAVLVPAGVIAIGFLTLRYVQLTTDLDFGKFAPLFDKWEFGVARIIDFTAVAAIAIRFRPLLKPLAVRPLVMLGQASLWVFCVHLLCVFFALTVMGNNAMLTGWPAAVLVVMSFTALLLTAIVANRRAVKAAAVASRVAPMVNLPPMKQQG
jgi:fucose 4-O-acetylase-like acetyltransferase